MNIIFTLLLFLQLNPLFPPLENRIGVCVDHHLTGDEIDSFEWDKISTNLWGYEYGVNNQPSQQITEHEMVWSTKNASRSTWLNNLTKRVNNHKGAKWLIGNEPDGLGQSNRTPAQYAVEYHTIYHTIKEADHTSLIYWGGISQPSPLRLVWLDLVIKHYEYNYNAPIPFDGLHVHGYIIPEVDGPGVGLAVGISSKDLAYRQEYWSLHSDLEVFKQQIASMRIWMKEHEYQNKPLIISEYGILLPIEWGYDSQAVGKFMTETMSWMLDYSESSYGNPLDNNKYVQEFAWFSANYTPHANSRLFNSNKELTELGHILKEFINGRQ